jgi:hypothetical protein
MRLHIPPYIAKASGKVEAKDPKEARFALPVDERNRLL